MKTIGVYKTNVDDPSRAKTIVQEIRRILPGSDPSIDLEDCDKVLRIEHAEGRINELKLTEIFARFGYNLEMLP